MTKRERMHAIVAWLYVKECARVCREDALKSHNFVRFVLDMYDAYPDECEEVGSMND